MEKFSTYQSLAFDKILISLLENEGISISTPTAIDIQKILSNTPTEEQSFAKLKYKIAPILCRNKEDQDKIYKFFDDLEINFPQRISLPEEEHNSSEIHPDDVQIKKPRNFKPVLFIFILTGLSILGWYFLKKTVSKPDFNIEISSNQIINKPVKFKAILTDSSLTKEYSVDWLINGEILKNRWEFEKTFKDSKTYQAKVLLRNNENIIVDSLQRYIEILCEEKPMVSISHAQTIQANKELYTPIITNSSWDSAKYTYQWFVDNKLTSTSKNLIVSKRKFNVYREIEVKVNCNGAHCDTDSLTTHLKELPSNKSQIITEGKPLLLKNSLNWKNFSLWILFFFILPFIFSVFLFYLLHRKKPEIAKLIEEDYGVEEPYSIEFINQDFLINDEIEVNNLADKLRKRQLSESQKLNIRKTILSSLSSVGSPQLVFTQRSKSTEYIILFDKEHSDSHLTHLFGYLIRKLQNEQINLTVYEYYKEPLFLSNEKLNLIRIPIERVATFHPDAIVIIIGESKNFVYPIKKKLKDWVTAKFRTWETKVLLTPFAIDDWDVKERLISEGGFLIIPSDMNAQENLDKVIFKQVDSQKDLKIPSTYSAHYLNLQSLEGLNNYLNNPNLLDWVCALAVYPYTDWNLTIAIGHAFEEKFKNEGQKTELVNYSNLLKLGRISWMHNSNWNEGLRVEMLQHLSNDNEILARETLLKQLDLFKEKLTNKSLIKKEFDVHHKLNSFLLEAFQKDAKSIQKEPIIEDMLNKSHVDEATEIYLNKGKNTLLKNPKDDKESLKVRDYFVARSEFGEVSRRNHNFKSFLASSIALIMLMLLSYNLLKNSKISTWKQTASSLITFKVKSLADKMGYSQYNGVIVIDSLQKEFVVKKDSSFVLKIPISDTSIFGKYKLQYFSVTDTDFNNLDSFKLNNDRYSLSLESMPQIPITIFYPAYNQPVAEALEAYFPGEFDTQIKQTIAVTNEYFIYYFDKKYESYANLCASIINKNLNKSISVALIKDSTNNIFPTVPIGIVIPKSKVDDWLPATLPSSMTEIWQAKTNNLMVTMNLSKRVLYYSTKGKDTYGTYSIYKVLKKEGKFKVIVSSNKGYKLFYFDNVKPASFDISICNKYFKTNAELYSITDSECNPYVNMTPSQQFSRDPERIYLPLNTNNFNWNSLFSAQKFSPNSLITVEYTNNQLLPAINLSNLEKSKLKIAQISKNMTSLSNPFERNFVKISTSTVSNSTSNTSTVQAINTKKKILWVDYSSDKNNSVINKFKNENVEFKMAYSDNVATDLLKKEKFDLIISGIGQSPVGDIVGIPFLKQIRKMPTEIPFIFFTSPRNVEMNMKEAYNLKVNLITSDISVLENGINNILYPKKAAQ